MQLIDVQSRDVYALFEISQTDLKKLVWCCKNVTINYDSKKVDEVEAKDYFMEKFFPQIDETLKGIEDKYGAPRDKKER